MFLIVFLFCLKVYSETLKEYNMRKFFLEKSFTKCAGEIFPRLFSTEIEHISGSIVQGFTQFFLLYAKLRVMEIYRN